MRKVTSSLLFLTVVAAAFALRGVTVAPAWTSDGSYQLFAPGLAADGIAAPPVPTPTPPGLVSCLVSNVVDGDTIDVINCADAGRIRLILIDTPEVFGGAECFGVEASNYTKAALTGKVVGLERDVSNTDQYGRYLRYVWIEGVLFNEQIVRDGYATMATYPPDVKYQARIQAAQQEASMNDRGLWSPTACASPTVAPPTPPPPAATPTPTAPAANNCHPSYPTVCIPPPPPDLDCGDIPYRNFLVLPPDPHHFDGNSDGEGCES